MDPEVKAGEEVVVEETKTEQEATPTLADAIKESVTESADEETPALEAKTEEVPVAKVEDTPVTKDAEPVDFAKEADAAGMKGRTRERFLDLGEKYKAVETEKVGIVQERDAALAKLDQLGQAVASTGATPEEFGQNLHFLTLVHSDVPADLEAALTMLDKAREGIAVRLGKPLPGIDVLAAHPDLADALENGDIDRARAEELAMLRQGKMTREQAVERHAATERQTSEQAQAELALGKQQVDLVDAAFRAADLQYAEKMKLMGPALQEIATTLPPSKWGEAWRAAYAAVKLAPPPAPIKTGMRASVTSTAQQPEPKTLGDALRVSMGIS